jgi:alpha-ribazole phosphatase
MKIIFIRHLRTPGNEKRQYIGRTDESLSDRALEGFLSSKNRYPAVKSVIASPMKRCIETARLIYPEAEIRTEPLLRECDFGLFEGKTYEELKDHPAYIEWLESGGMAAFPEGEPQELFRNRCAEGVQKWIEILLEEKAESAAFVVHGGTIMASLSRLAEEPHDFYHWQVENGGGYEALVTEREWLNGRKHLKEVRRIHAQI